MFFTVYGISIASRSADADIVIATRIAYSTLIPDMASDSEKSNEREKSFISTQNADHRRRRRMRGKSGWS